MKQIGLKISLFVWIRYRFSHSIVKVKLNSHILVLTSHHHR